MRLRQDYILELTERHRYITPTLVARKLFKFPSGRNKAQQLMGCMARDGLLNRFRVGGGEYIYHVGKRSNKWRHWLELTRFHFALLAELKAWQKIVFWQNEYAYPYGVADGFYILRLTIDGDGLMFFLEADDGGNVFDKVPKYMAYQTSGAWRQEWWGQSFPLVLVVTPRAEEVRLLVERSQGAKNIFRVMLSATGEGNGIMAALSNPKRFKYHRE